MVLRRLGTRRVVAGPSASPFGEAPISAIAAPPGAVAAARGTDDFAATRAVVLSLLLPEMRAAPAHGRMARRMLRGEASHHRTQHQRACLRRAARVLAQPPHRAQRPHDAEARVHFLDELPQRSVPDAEVAAVAPAEWDRRRCFQRDEEDSRLGGGLLRRLRRYGGTQCRARAPVRCEPPLAEVGHAADPRLVRLSDHVHGAAVAHAPDAQLARGVAGDGQLDLAPPGQEAGEARDAAAALQTQGAESFRSGQGGAEGRLRKRPIMLNQR